MTAQQRPYLARDFVAVRDLISRACGAFPKLTSWRIERWNYSRWFVTPMLGLDETVESLENSLAGIRAWEGRVTVWEDQGQIVAAVLHEDVRVTPAYIQREPRYDALLPDIVTVAEETLADPETGARRIMCYDHDEPLQAVLRERGYAVVEAQAEHDSVYTVADVPPMRLPEGYVIRSIADECDIDRRREVFGRAFNHEEPKDWPSAFSYACLMQAPDYRPEQDLFVVAPDGRYAACCIIWYDAANRLGILEPVGTHPDFRRRGLGREVVLEAIRRVAASGASHVQVGSSQLFYQSIGFEVRYTASVWARP